MKNEFVFRYIPYQSCSASFNMALDEYLMTLDGLNLRFYGWNKPTISYGKATKCFDHMNQNVIKAHDFEQVIRPTGGKTVFHHQELTYSLSGNAQIFRKKILESYKIISQILTKAFEKLAIQAEMKAEKLINKSTSNCFFDQSTYEITVKNKKLVGSAQFRRRDQFLQHGSILLHNDWTLYEKIWIDDDAQGLKKRMTSINEETKKDIDPENLSKLILDQFNQNFETEFREYKFSETEIAQIEKNRQKYVF